MYNVIYNYDHLNLEKNNIDMLEMPLNSIKNILKH